MRLKVISYYSPNYHNHAVKLIESCKTWGVDHEVTAVKPFKTWHQGVSSKPTFIRRKLDDFSDYDALLWVDADAYIVRRMPIDDFTGVDVSAAKFQWTQGHKIELLTGTLFFAVNNAVKLFVDQWIKETKLFIHSDTPEQDSLMPLINIWRNTVSFKHMDNEWCWIDDDRFEGQFRGKIPIIRHSQASRQIRAEEFRRDQSQGKT
jgi:hypothetical protein